MFGGQVVEIVLVLLFVFVTMSAIVSSTQELIFQALGWRTRNLRRTIERMLYDEVYQKEIGKRVYRHPLLNGAGGARKQVTHIAPETFAIAVATAVQPSWSNGDPVAALPESVQALRDGDLKRRLQLIIPQPKETEAYRDTIHNALTAWFDSSIRKAQETYKADARTLSYMIAAVVTVTLNVSPIEITQRLLADDALRTSVTSAMPELAPVLRSAGTTPADPVTELSKPAEAMLAVFRCSENQTSLPIGWPWMAGALDALGNNRFVAGVIPSETEACQQAAAAAQAAGAVPGAAPVSSFEREFGPNFRTDPPLLVLAGWLIMVVAAAQGAPFWFSLIQKMIRR